MATAKSEENRTLIRTAFEQWAAGKGDIFQLLSDDAVWEISGSDPSIAKTYRSREALLDGAARPLAARLTGPLRPTVKQIWVDGDDVIVSWAGEGDVYDGSKYRNDYLWVMTVKDRKIVAVKAFLDIPAFKAVLDKPLPAASGGAQ